MTQGDVLAETKKQTNKNKQKTPPPPPPTTTTKTNDDCGGGEVERDWQRRGGGREGLRDCVYVGLGVRVRACVDAGEGQCIIKLGCVLL